MSESMLYEALSALQPGDSLFLGRYPLPGSSDRTDVTVKCPIAWLVLDKDESRLLLLSKHALYWNFFDGSGSLFGPAPETSWEASTLRAELNGERFDAWFSDTVKSLVKETVVLVDENPVYHTATGSGTFDKLFLLSAEEAGRYLGVGVETSEASDGGGKYAAAPFMILADRNLEDGSSIELDVAYMPWWLRTPGADATRVACVSGSGHVDLEGIRSSADEVGVRPAMWIDFSHLAKDQEG